MKDLTRIEELDRVEHLLSLLPVRVMSPLSMSNLAGELETSHNGQKLDGTTQGFIWYFQFLLDA